MLTSRPDISGLKNTYGNGKGVEKVRYRFIRYPLRICDAYSNSRMQTGILLFGHVINIRVRGRPKNNLQKECCNDVAIKEKNKFGQAPSETWGRNQKIA